MKLTAKQERMVRDFIRETDASADNLPKPAQKHAKNAMRQRLKQELSAFGEEIPRDEQVQAILRRCRVPDLNVVENMTTQVMAPAKPAVPDVPQPAPQPERTSFTDESRIWAGVCAAWAERLGVETVVVRGAFLLVGLVMPPIAFLAYFAGYVELAVRSGDAAVPTVESGVLFLNGLVAAVQVLALFAAGYLVPRIAIDVSTQFLPELAVRLGVWGWYQGIEWTAFWFTFLLAVPMRLVATLPLLHDWDKTLGLFARLVIALYAVLISFGIASGLAGLAIEIIEVLAQ